MYEYDWIERKYLGLFNTVYTKVNLNDLTKCTTVNLSVMSSSPIKGPRCFLEQETLLSLLSTGWFQERIRA